MDERKSELYYEELGDNFDLYMSEYDVMARFKLRQNMCSNFDDIDYSNVLEVGCGTGRVTESFYSLCEKLTVSDISEKLAESTAKRFSCIGKKEDACSISFSDSTFSFLFSSECIEHTPSPEEALREMVRVLKPGGKLLITSPNLLWYPVVWLAMKFKARKFQGNEVFLSPSRVRGILKQSGATVLTMSGCHLYPWQIPFLNKLLPFFDNFGTTLYPAMIN